MWTVVNGAYIFVHPEILVPQRACDDEAVLHNLGEYGRERIRSSGSPNIGQGDVFAHFRRCYDLLSSDINHSKAGDIRGRGGHAQSLVFALTEGSPSLDGCVPNLARLDSLRSDDGYVFRVKGTDEATSFYLPLAAR